MTIARRTLFLLLFAASLMLPAATTILAQGRIVRAGADKIDNEYIVVLEDDVLPEQVPELARQIAGAHGLRAEKIWNSAIKAFFTRMPEAKAEALSRSPRVKYVEENARWALSATIPTNINPITCDPTVSNCPSVVDDRLWHLDRADQNRASPNNRYSYTTDGTGVTVYVVDTGVNKNHQEFAGSGRVKAGFNATNDFMPADDPCVGFAIPADPNYSYESNLYFTEVLGSGHGTSVASALGGKRTGIAKNVNIVPVKVLRCDKWTARHRIANHFYQQYETVYHSPNTFNAGVLYRAQNAGTTAATEPTGWPTGDHQTVQDGGITWEVIPDETDDVTTQHLIDGLNWILSPLNPGPKSYAVVTLSTYRVATENLVAGTGNTVEQAIRTLLANNLTVIASANNQNGNACDTSPARLSRNNPDTTVANDVITAGGSMIINQPWTVDVSDVGGIPADGPRPNGQAPYGVQPPYDATKAVREGRWICGEGDSSLVCNNPTPTSTPNPAFPNSYRAYQGGSNAGPCVTLFAPAKNLFLATPAGANTYRDARVRGGHGSGTSWSAPIVAGFVARLLQNQPTLTPVQVRSALLANSVATLDTATLDSYDYQNNRITGTPNKLLQFGDVNIIQHPQSVTSSGPATLSVTASGTSALSYQWYEVNAGFDLATFNYGADASSPIAGATFSNFSAPASQSVKAYWVRVSNSGGSADSNIAVVTPGPACQPGVITQQPQSQTIIPGASATIGVTVSGTGPFQYQFYQGESGQYTNATGVNSPINTGPLYTTKPYWVQINDPCIGGYINSATAWITVQCTAAPGITQQPTSRTINPGQSTTLSVSATQGVSYQWYIGTSPSGTAITNATNPTLTVSPSSTTSYWVRVTNGCGTANSVTATVCVLPAITAQPTSRTINPGQSTTLTVSAINATSYQWYQGTASSTATPVGTNSSSLTVSPLVTTNYWVRVINACGSVDSTTATVTVAPVPPPQITRIQSAFALANSQTSITANWPQPTQTGTFLVAVVSGVFDPYMNFTAPAGWSHAVTSEWNNIKLAIYYRPNNPGARTSETFTVSPGYHDMTLYILEYSGIMATNPLDKTGIAGNDTNNGYVQTGFTQTTVQPKELVITGLTTYTQTEFSTTPADGYTEVYDKYMLYHLTTAMYEKITTATGSYGHGATVYVPAEWVGVVATFKGADTN